jgi:CBS domain-containing protein
MSAVKAAQDFMRRNLVTLAPHSDVFDSITLMLRDNISGAPVVDSAGNYLGVFSEKCSLNALTKPVEAAKDAGHRLPRVRDFMTCDLVTLSPDQDVFASIDHILGRRISGAPVVDREGRYQGIFSEKTAMQVLVAAVYDQLPGTNVACYMNLDRNRIIEDQDCLLDIAHKFQETPYRRLPVLDGEKLAGQVSRRDVLRAEQRVAADMLHRSDKEIVESYMDRTALTALPSTDMLSIAQMFLNSPYRRMPIVEKGKLLGMVSRRDVLESAASILRPKPRRQNAEPLYFSGLANSAPPSIT